MLTKPISQLPTLPGDHTSIKKKIDATYTANNAIWQAHQREAVIDTRLEAGDISLNADIGGGSQGFYNGRASYYFNRTRPLCNMVSGRQRDQRKSLIVVPLESGDQETSDQMTKVLLHLFTKNQFDDTFSEAFHQGACITGMNLIQTYIDFTDDPIFGDIKFKNLTFNQFFIDPYFRNKDLSDCNFVWVRSYLTHSAAASLMPQYYDEIMALPGNPTGTSRDGRFNYMPQAYGISGQNLIAYDEYYYRDFRTRKILIDRNVGLWREVTAEEMETTDFEFMMDMHPQLIIETQVIPTVRMAILIQDRVFYDGQNPFSIDCYPFVPVIGYYNPMMPYFYSRIQGICRSLRDPQMLLNRRIILSADLLESQANSGYIFKVGSVIDMKHLFQTGQGRVIPLKDEAQMTDVQQISPPVIPPSFFQLQETFSKEMNMVSGINEELMGSAMDDKAGILSALRQGAGLVTLRPLFDNADFSLKMIGELVLKMVMSNYGPIKVQMILEGQPPTQQFYNKAFAKYHCQVEAGFSTETQKQMQFAQLLQLTELGVPIPPSQLIASATLQKKTELIQQMEQQQQMQQQQQQIQMQLQVQQAQAQIGALNAKAVADVGLGRERDSRIEENSALAIERRAQAHRDDATAEREHEAALLTFIRATKELEGIDIEHLHRMTEISKMLREMETRVSENPTTEISNARLSAT